MSNRKEFTKKTKLQAWKSSNGVCWHCCLPIWASNGPVQYDHIIPDGLDPEESNALHNCQVLCKPCHAIKTDKPIDGDKSRIAKANRGLEKRANVRKKSGHSMPGSRNSKYKKHMDGSVSIRNPYNSK